jgi:hypothetical protein
MSALLENSIALSDAARGRVLQHGVEIGIRHVVEQW